VKESAATAYTKRFEKVLDYIQKHLGEELSVEHLSRVANFSKYHFHRQFSCYVGVSVGRYIQLLRLRRASYRLVFEDRIPIIDIALEAGFENPESFSRTFKVVFNQTPSQFRREPDWLSWHQQFRFPTERRSHSMNVNIVDFPSTRVAVLRHRGAPERVNDTAKVFIEWRKESGLSPVQSSHTYGIAYDDPSNTQPETFRFDICGSVNEPIAENRFGIINGDIPAGRCAVLRHRGPHAHLTESVYYLCREWLPASGEELRDYPLFFHYLNLITDTPENELITDIYLPLQ